MVSPGGSDTMVSRGGEHSPLLGGGDEGRSVAAASVDSYSLREPAAPGWYLVCLGLLGLCGGWVYGMNVAASAYLDAVTQRYGLNEGGQSLLSCSATLMDAASMFVVGAFFLDRWGRRNTVVAGAVLCVVGSTVGATLGDRTFSWLIAGRLLQGVGNGLSILAVPMLVSENAPLARRGALVTMFQVGVVVGFTVPFVVQLAADDWRVTVAAGGAPGLLLLSTILPIWKRSESAAWLAHQAQLAAEAERAASGEAGLIATATSDSGAARSGGSERCGRSRDASVDGEALDDDGAIVDYAKGVALAIVLAFCNNSSDSIVFYGPQILQNAGIGGKDSLWTAFALAAINIPFAALVLAVIHRFPRRTMLLVGLGIIVLCYIVVGVCFSTNPDHLYGLIVLMFLVLMVAFQAGPGTLFIVVLPELFSQRRRAVGMAFGTVSMSVFSIVCNGTLLMTIKALGAGPTFLLYASAYAACFVVLLRHLPESGKVRISGPMPRRGSFALAQSQT